MCLQLGFERGERLGVLQSRREVVPQNWSSRLKGVRTIASLAGIVMIAREIARDRETMMISCCAFSTQLKTGEFSGVVVAFLS